MNKKRPTYLNFKKENYAWSSDVDYRKYPEKYKVGKGEQGVLICEPYKSEIGKFWRFKNESIALESSEIIYKMFLDYLKENDFVGADMARKYLQMGFTRSKRYFNYKGGKKYNAEKNYQEMEPGTGDPEKLKSANIFKKKWKKVELNPKYKLLKKQWKIDYG